MKMDDLLELESPIFNNQELLINKLRNQLDENNKIIS